MTFKKWFVLVKFTIWDFSQNFVALLDSGADQNCIKEGIVPSRFYEKTKISLHGDNGTPLQIKYKLSKAYITNDNYVFRNSFILVKDIREDII